MKCTRCGAKAAIEIKRHKAAFCKNCFNIYVTRQVERAIKDHEMFKKDDKLLIAVSGGKDSLVAWDVLSGLDYKVDGLHVQLGIFEYSENSLQITEKFASERGLKLHVVDLYEKYSIRIPEIEKRTGRPACSGCGIVKRYIYNEFGMKNGYDVLITGHNLDDDAAMLLNNVFGWEIEYLRKLSPVSPGVTGLWIKKVKPLYRLTERETAAYAFLNGIQYLIQECPFSRNATQLYWKKILNQIEQEKPGTKQQFYFKYLKNKKLLFNEKIEPEIASSLSRCKSCGGAARGEYCSFCKLRKSFT